MEGTRLLSILELIELKDKKKQRPEKLENTRKIPEGDVQGVGNRKG